MMSPRWILPSPAIAKGDDVLAATAAEQAATEQAANIRMACNKARADGWALVMTAKDTLKELADLDQVYEVNEGKCLSYGSPIYTARGRSDLRMMRVQQGWQLCMRIGLGPTGELVEYSSRIQQLAGL